MLRCPLQRAASSSVAATAHNATSIGVTDSNARITPSASSAQNGSECVVRSLREMPGPRPLPFIGNVWRYFPLIGDYRIDKLHESGHFNLHKYGPIVREHVHGSLTIVHLFDPKHIEQVFRTEGRYPERRSHRAVGKYRRDRTESFNSGGIFCE